MDDRTVVVAAATSVQTGSVIKGRFELVELLGEGGMGKVFKAVDRVRSEAGERDAFLAVKVLAPAFSRLEVASLQLLREARKALSLTHPNIVRAYDFDRDGQTVFMTMELLSGRSLESVVRAPAFGGLPAEQALHILRGAAAALAHAHDCGLVHSDFKPSNVFLTDAEQVKVIDFGIARTLKPRDGGGDAPQTLFDPAALRALTPPYASPEQFEGQPPDRRDDVFALACVAYEMLAGRHPFDRMASVMAMAHRREPAPIDGVGARPWAALKRALAFRREDRTPTIDQFMAEFTAAPGTGRRPLLLAAGGMAGLCAAGGLAAWLLWPAPPTSTPALTPAPAPATEQRPQQVTAPGAGPAGTPSLPLPEAPPAVVDPAAVRAIVRALPCALLQADTSAGVLRLRGVAHDPAELASLNATLQAIPGIGEVLAEVGSVGGAQCPPLAVIRPLVFAGWDGGSPLAVQPTRAEFVAGTPLTLDLLGFDRDGYITVDYYDSLGNVVHMLPRVGGADNRVKAGERLRLGTGGGHGEWIVAEPYGHDLVTLIQTAKPLWRNPRKAEVERTDDYLPALREALAREAAANPATPALATFAVVTTRPQ